MKLTVAYAQVFLIGSMNLQVESTVSTVVLPSNSLKRPVHRICIELFRAYLARTKSYNTI